MQRTAYRRNPERVAWAVLLASFFTFCALIVAVTFGGRWWLLNAAVAQTITLNSSGPVRVLYPESAQAVFIVNGTIPAGSTLAVPQDAQASLRFTTRDGRTELASVQIYGETEVVITRASSPRFVLGVHPHQIWLNMVGGRMRAVVVGGGSQTRTVKIEIWSKPETVTTLEEPGSNASVEASVTQTVVTVREGMALVSSRGQGIALRPDQRGEVPLGAPPRGPFDAERNLIVNSDFSTGIADSASLNWEADIRKPYDPNESPGTVEIVTKDGRSAVRFVRTGTNWGRVGVIQEINRDVRDFKSLRVHLDLFVEFQDLGNCGAAGTECPVMVKVEYVDAGGGQRGWLQGFYSAESDPAFGGLTSCPGCSELRSDHQPVPPGQWYTYETEGNLLEMFAAAGYPAVIIKSITVYAEGHRFISYVTDVQLLGSE